MGAGRDGLNRGDDPIQCVFVPDFGIECLVELIATVGELVIPANVASTGFVKYGCPNGVLDDLGKKPSDDALDPAYAQWSDRKVLMKKKTLKGARRRTVHLWTQEDQEQDRVLWVFAQMTQHCPVSICGRQANKDSKGFDHEFLHVDFYALVPGPFERIDSFEHGALACWAALDVPVRGIVAEAQLLRRERNGAVRDRCGFFVTWNRLAETEPARNVEVVDRSRMKQNMSRR